MEKRVIIAIGLCVAVLIALDEAVPGAPRPRRRRSRRPHRPPRPATAVKPTVTGRGRRRPPAAPAGAAITNRPEQTGRARHPGRPLRLLEPGGTLLHAELGTRSSATDRRTRRAATIWWGRPIRKEAPLRTTFPRSGFPDTGRRRLGDAASPPRTRSSSRPTRGSVHIEKRYRRRHHPLPPPPRRHGHQPRRRSRSITTWPSR